ncbi:MAG: phosphatidylglycerophosphatase A [Candidatus Omnitrophota bacterium]|nr:MAG: phosphatidylglycerophosphatase A [Candidatus Omnitrophota bacterium]
MNPALSAARKFLAAGRRVKKRNGGMKTVIKMVASGLYLGYSPIASGTIGSLLGVLIFLQLHNFPLLYICVCLVLILLGFLISGKAEEIYKQKDSPKIVIDEIAGMCIVYLGLPAGQAGRQARLWIIVIGFLIYRALDVIKPPPAKRVEKIKGSAGIMLDDIICAIYANIMLQVLTRLPLNIGS